MRREFKIYAARNNGVITWLFDQKDIDPEGLCASLCVHWIRYHSSDRHLSTELYTKKKIFFKTISFVNSRELRNIAALQNSDEILPWLESVGLRPLFHPVTNEIIYAHKDYVMNDMVVGDFCTQSHLMVNQLLKYKLCYIFIAIYDMDIGESVDTFVPIGHTLCCWLGDLQSDAILFEPNSGEVWFERREHFAKFARDYFADLMLRARLSGWHLYPFVKPASVQGFEMVYLPEQRDW